MRCGGLLVNFSLNIVEDGNLLMRTQRESQARDVWLNDFAAKRVIATARIASIDKPLLLDVALASHDKRITTLREMGRLFSSPDEHERSTLCSVELAMPVRREAA